MRITGLSITNFRSFQEAQKIDFAPITLLFGPNSVGKSTVLMALSYIQHIINEGCNPEYLTVLGEKHVGGFASLVNGGDLNKSIILKLDLDDQPSAISYHDSEVRAMLDVGVLNPVDEVISFSDTSAGGRSSFEFEIAWSRTNNTAYIKAYRVWVDGCYVGCIESKPDMRNAQLTELNADHPRLETVNDQLDKEESDDHDSYDEWRIVSALQNLNPNTVVSPKEVDDQRAGQSVRSQIFPVAVAATRHGAMPRFNERLELELYIGDEQYEDADFINSHLINIQLSTLFNSCLVNVHRYLNQSVFIGPIRTVPDATFQANIEYRQRDWFDGRAAWDMLYSNVAGQNRLLSEVSSCLDDEDKLNTGYSLYKTSLAEQLSDSDVAILPNPILRELDQAKVYFRENGTETLLNASQLGTGISQIFPIVVAACKDDTGFRSGGILSVEQPELHIHPRLQTQVADLLAEAALRSNNAKPNIIETHSEHLILRLLRRVRQTTDGELPEGNVKVSPGDISVVYLEPSASGVKAKAITVDEKGEFDERWPQGFFSERAEELF